MVSERKWHEEIELNTAISRGNVAEVRRLVAANADVNIMSFRQEFPLYLAAKLGQVEIIRTLLANPFINVNLKNANGYSALLIAAMHDNREIVRELLMKGADIRHDSVVISDASGYSLENVRFGLELINQVFVEIQYENLGFGGGEGAAADAVDEDLVAENDDPVVDLEVEHDDPVAEHDFPAFPAVLAEVDVPLAVEDVAIMPIAGGLVDEVQNINLDGPNRNVTNQSCCAIL